jgi:hypothetical protein
MRIRSLTVALVAAAVGALTLLAPGSATAGASTAPEVTGSDAGVIDGFVAVPVSDGSTTQQEPPPFECFWGWNWQAGGAYPEAWLQYAVTFECGPDFGVGPDISGVLQGSLHDAPGGLTLHTGPDEAFLFCCDLELPPVTSGGEYTLTGPGSFFIRSDSIVDLLPEPDGTIWVWAYLPDGCEGVGSPRAVCVIDSPPFNT